MHAAAQQVPHLSVEELFDSPARVNASISPDGTRIAYLAPWRDRLNVWVQSLDSDEEPRCVTADTDRSVLTYHWSDDPRWLLYEQDRDGDELWHIHRVDLDDPDAQAVDLTPFPGALALGFQRVPSRPGKAFLHLNHRNPAEFDLYELDIATGELTILAQNPGQPSGWMRAPDGSLYAQSLTADGDIELARWDASAGKALPVARFDGRDYPLSIHPFELTEDGTGVWLGSNRDSDRTRLVRLDLATGAETEVDSHPEFDLDTRCAVFPTLPSPLIRNEHTGALLGVRYLGERQVIHPLDPHFA
ncbi:TolB family protein [Streptomyces sp. NPDC017988]|uniref:TolB family protein n=1 Tax=Streptomyces sp. NPDC017988 TaxID=3365025 RepID=UPI003796C23A